MSDEDTDATGDEWRSKPFQVTTAYGRARCNWAGFRHGLTQWRRWKRILAVSVVDERRRRRVTESQMVMGVIWQRAALGNKWQIVRAKVQDEQEIKDMQRMGTAAELALRLAQRRREIEQEGHEERVSMADIGHHAAKHHKKTKRVKVKKSRARAASSRLIRESVQSKFDEELRDAVYSLAPVKRMLRAAPKAQVCGITEEEESMDTNSSIKVVSSRCNRGARRRVYKPRVQKAGKSK